MQLLRFIILSPVGASLPAQPIDSWDRVPPAADPLIHTIIMLDEDGEDVLKLGGHARTMTEFYRNRDFGFAKVPDDSWIHHRIQASASWDIERRLKFFSELTWGEMQGMEGEPSPPDEDHPDLLQLYAQARFNPGNHDELLARAGRQVLYYGSGRLLAHREGANQRLVFDALRVSWLRAAWQVDGLIASPVKIERDAFDNTSHPDQALLWGLYAAAPSPFGKDHGIDFYYLGLRRDSSPLAPGQEDLRHTLGTRWFGKNGPWSYNHEFILQTGDVADRDVFAGAVSLGAGFTFKQTLFEPSLGLRGDLISGGQGGSINTFDPLFQANNYFNEGGFISPSNLYNLNPRLMLQLTETLGLDLGVNFLWRFDPGDGVYVPPFDAVAGAAPDGERYLGTAYNIALAWNPHPAIDLSIGFTHHEAGPSLTSVGGKSVDYLQAAARIEF